MWTAKLAEPRAITPMIPMRRRPGGEKLELLRPPGPALFHQLCHHPPTPPLREGSWPTRGKGWVSTFREPMASNTMTTPKVAAVAFQLSRAPGRRTAARTATFARRVGSRRRRRAGGRGRGGAGKGGRRRAEGCHKYRAALSGRYLSGRCRSGRCLSGRRRRRGSAVLAPRRQDRRDGTLRAGRGGTVLRARRGSGRHPGQLVAPFQAQPDHGPEPGATPGLQLPQVEIARPPQALGPPAPVPELAGAAQRAEHGGDGVKDLPAGPAVQESPDGLGQSEKHRDRSDQHQRGEAVTGPQSAQPVPLPLGAQAVGGHHGAGAQTPPVGLQVTDAAPGAPR